MHAKIKATVSFKFSSMACVSWPSDSKNFIPSFYNDIIF